MTTKNKILMDKYTLKCILEKSPVDFQKIKSAIIGDISGLKKMIDDVEEYLLKVDALDNIPLELKEVADANRRNLEMNKKIMLDLEYNYKVILEVDNAKLN